MLIYYIYINKCLHKFYTKINKYLDKHKYLIYYTDLIIYL